MRARVCVCGGGGVSVVWVCERVCERMWVCWVCGGGGGVSVCRGEGGGWVCGVCVWRGVCGGGGCVCGGGL